MSENILSNMNSLFISTPSSNSNLQRNQNHAHQVLSSAVMDTSSSPQYNRVHDTILYINVGGRWYNTTKQTMAKTGLFARLLGKKRGAIFDSAEAQTQKQPSHVVNVSSAGNEQHEEHEHEHEHEQKSKESHSRTHTSQRSDASEEIQYFEVIPREERIKRQTTFENYCVEHLEKGGLAESNTVSVTVKNHSNSTDAGNNGNKNKAELSDNDDFIDDEEELLSDEIPAGVCQLDTNCYFVDRAPQFFDDILHFLRNYPRISADTFVQRYYAPAVCGGFGVRRNSLSALSSNHSGTNIMDMLSSNNNPLHKHHFARRDDLLRLQDEAKFYQIRSLVRAIQDRLNEYINEVTLHFAASASTTQTPLTHHPQHPSYGSNPTTNLSATTTAMAPTQYTHTNMVNNAATMPAVASMGNNATSKLVMHSPNSTLMLDKQSYALSWWDQSGPQSGLRKIRGTRIAFATAMDNWVDKNAHFEAPPGYVWATQAQYLDEYYNRRDLLCKMKEWIHFGVGGWSNYRWKYARKIAFIFRDTFKGQRFIHSGMEVCDINHVKSLFGLMAESPLMEYDDQRGIVEGFAGLVLLSDDIWYGDETTNDGQEAQGDDSVPHKVASLTGSSALKLAETDKTRHRHHARDSNNNKDHDLYSLQSSDENENESDMKTKEVKADNDVDDKDNENDNEKKQAEDAKDATGNAAASNTKKSVKCTLDVTAMDDDGDWTSEEDEEQIRSLADKFKDDYHKDDDDEDAANALLHPQAVDSNDKNKGDCQVLAPIHSSTIISTASVQSPGLPPPELANPPELAAYTQRRRAALTQHNLQRHTMDEYMKHQQRQPPQSKPPQEQPKLVQQNMPPPAPLQQSLTTPQSSTVHRKSPNAKSLSKNAAAFQPSSPSYPQFTNFGSFPYPQQVHSPPHHAQQYVHGLPMLSPQTHGFPPQHMPPNGHMQHAAMMYAPNGIPMIPPPQLQQRLSVNSLPVQNNSRVQHHSSRTLHNI